MIGNKLYYHDFLYHLFLRGKMRSSVLLLLDFFNNTAKYESESFWFLRFHNVCYVGIKPDLKKILITCTVL